MIKTGKKTKSGRDIYLDGNKEVTLQRVGGKHQTKMPDYAFRSFRKPQPSGVNYTRNIVVKPILKIRIKGEKIIIYQ